MEYSRPPQRDAWFAPLSLDLILKVLRVTFLHPFLAWIIPLCFRAQTMRWDAPPMLVAIAWASCVTLSWVAGIVNQRVAYGLPRDVDLSEEVIVITGGASGLGLLIAEVYGMRGATVAVLDVREMENGEARGVTYYKCDVGDKAQVARVAAEIERDLGTPSILINNAAIVHGKPLLDLPLESIERSLHTNLLAPFYTLKTFLPGMLASPHGGTVVTLSSVLGHLGAARLTDYAAAKAGLTALHKSLEAELRAAAAAKQYPAGDNLKLLLVEPGQLSTPLFYGVQTPNAFLAPVVEPVDVCREVVAAIDAGRSGRVASPFYAKHANWFNVLPAGLQVLASKVAGVDDAMRGFVGRSSDGEKLGGKGPRGEDVKMKPENEAR